MNYSLPILVCVCCVSYLLYGGVGGISQKERDHFNA